MVVDDGLRVALDMTEHGCGATNWACHIDASGIGCHDDVFPRIDYDIIYTIAVEDSVRTFVGAEQRLGIDCRAHSLIYAKAVDTDKHRVGVVWGDGSHRGVGYVEHYHALILTLSHILYNLDTLGEGAEP